MTNMRLNFSPPACNRQPSPGKRPARLPSRKRHAPPFVKRWRPLAWTGASFLLLTGFLVAGCASSEEKARAEAREAELRSLHERSQEQASIPLPVERPPRLAIPEDPEESEVPTGPEEALPNIPVRDIGMGREADLAVVLRALARGADINVVLGRSISGPVLLNLPKETTWDRLFKMIVETHGLHYEFQDGLLRVMDREDVERQIALERSLKERELAREERQRAEPLVIELYRVRYAEAETLANSVKSGMASLQGQEETIMSVVPDPDSGLLVIQASRRKMPDILNLIESLDQPAYQILLEATIVQANSETARQLGMQWGLLHTAPDQGRVSVGTTGNADGFNANFPAQFDSGDPGFTFGLSRLSGNQFLQAQLSALQRDGRLDIISSPSITTLDKQTALIESGEERPFQSATGSGLGATATVEFKKALLSLEVTPQVIDGEWIKLKIHTTKDEFDDSRPILIDGTLQVPIITRLATTTLYLADGQTTVIGGLSTDSQSEQVEGVPLLKNLPLLGPLFRSTNQRTALSDTLIFITPRILPERVPPGRLPALEPYLPDDALNHDEDREAEGEAE